MPIQMFGKEYYTVAEAEAAVRAAGLGDAQVAQIVTRRRCAVKGQVVVPKQPVDAYIQAFVASGKKKTNPSTQPTQPTKPETQQPTKPETQQPTKPEPQTPSTQPQKPKTDKDENKDKKDENKDKNKQNPTEKSEVNNTDPAAQTPVNAGNKKYYGVPKSFTPKKGEDDIFTNWDRQTLNSVYAEAIKSGDKHQFKSISNDEEFFGQTAVEIAPKLGDKTYEQRMLEEFVAASIALNPEIFGNALDINAPQYNLRLQSNIGEMLKIPQTLVEGFQEKPNPNASDGTEPNKDENKDENKDKNKDEKPQSSSDKNEDKPNGDDPEKKKGDKKKVDPEKQKSEQNKPPKEVKKPPSTQPTTQNQDNAPPKKVTREDVEEQFKRKSQGGKLKTKEYDIQGKKVKYMECVKERVQNGHKVYDITGVITTDKGQKNLNAYNRLSEQSFQNSVDKFYEYFNYLNPSDGMPCLPSAGDTRCE